MVDLPKMNSARTALKFVKKGMTVGLGTGRNANLFIDLLAERDRKERLGIKCIPTSKRSAERAASTGLALVNFEKARHIDLTVDGADIVSSKLYLLKGLGGALGGEKFVAYRSRKFVVIVEESKMRKNLDGVVAIEVVPFAASAVLREVSHVSKKASLRMASKSQPFITDNGNHLIDAHMNVANPEQREKELNLIPGVVENGIFTRADVVLVGREKGCRILRNKRKFLYSPFSRRK